MLLSSEFAGGRQRQFFKLRKSWWNRRELVWISSWSAPFSQVAHHRAPVLCFDHQLKVKSVNDRSMLRRRRMHCCCCFETAFQNTTREMLVPTHQLRALYYSLLLAFFVVTSPRLRNCHDQFKEDYIAEKGKMCVRVCLCLSDWSNGSNLCHLFVASEEVLTCQDDTLSD